MASLAALLYLMYDLRWSAATARKFREARLPSATVKAKPATRIPPAKLPPELLILVAVHVATDRNRSGYSTLLILCRTSRLFCAVAQPLIFEDILPKTRAAWNAALEVLQARTDLADGVRMLRFGQWSIEEEPVDLHATLERLPNLQLLVTPALAPTEPLPPQSHLTHGLFRIELLSLSAWRAPSPHNSSPSPFPSLSYLVIHPSSSNPFHLGYRLPPPSLLSSLRGLVVPIGLGFAARLPSWKPDVPLLWSASFATFCATSHPTPTPSPSSSHSAVETDLYYPRYLRLARLVDDPAGQTLDALTSCIKHGEVWQELEVLALPKQWKEGFLGSTRRRVVWERVVKERRLKVVYEEEEEDVRDELGTWLPAWFVAICEARRCKSPV